jgi:phosphoribosylaminoimidazole-succinocarboxamide synthase
MTVQGSIPLHQKPPHLKRRKAVHDGASKTLCDGTTPSTYILSFKDSVSIKQGSDVKLIEDIPGKGAINNRFCEKFMACFDFLNIPNHHISNLNMREQIVHMAVPAGFDVMVYNFTTPELCNYLNLDENTILNEPLIEFKIKDRMVSEKHLVSLGLIDADDLDDMSKLISRINDVVFGACHGVGLRLNSLKLEFGRLYNPEFDEFGQLILIDDITPEKMHLQDISSGALYGDAFLTDPVTPTEFEIREMYQVLSEKFNLFPTRDN